MVDSVSKALNLNIKDDDDVEEVPSFGAKIDNDYILGITKMESEVKIMLDIDEGRSSGELAL